MERRDFLWWGVLGILSCGSCAGNRMGTLPWWTSKVNEASSLGKHRSLSERGGQVYTLDAGPIDVTHARIVIDDARKVYDKIYCEMVKGKENFSFGIRDNCFYDVQLNYPSGFSGEEEFVRNASIDMAGYFSYVDSVWHEVRGWYGKNTILFVPDFASAFSCEDNVSNAFGAKVFGITMRDSRNFNDVVSEVIENELMGLRTQPRSVGKIVAKYTKGPRHFDIGLKKGYLIPWNVPGRESEAYPVPDLNVLDKYGGGINWRLFASSKQGRKAFRSIGVRGDGWIGVDGLVEIVDVIEKNWNSRAR